MSKTHSTREQRVASLSQRVFHHLALYREWSRRSFLTLGIAGVALVLYVVSSLIANDPGDSWALATILGDALVVATALMILVGLVAAAACVVIGYSHRLKAVHLNREIADIDPTRAILTSLATEIGRGLREKIVAESREGK